MQWQTGLLGPVGEFLCLVLPKRADGWDRGQVPNRFSSKLPNGPPTPCSLVRGLAGRPSVLSTFHPIEGMEAQWLLLLKPICVSGVPGVRLQTSPSPTRSSTVIPTGQTRKLKFWRLSLTEVTN